MSLYKHILSGEIKEIDDSWMAALIAAGNPKTSAYEIYVAPPPPEPLPPTAQEIWQQKLASGWTDSNTGIKLKTTEAARNLFAGQMTMIMAALQVGAITTDTPLSIWDYSEQEHTLTVAQMMGLLLRYGFAWQAMFAEFAP